MISQITANSLGGAALGNLGYTPVNKSGDSMSGVLLQPTQISFLVKPNSNASSEMIGSTFAWTGVMQNVGSAYNASTGVFTAPVSGTYIFGANVMFVSGTGRCQTIIAKNDTWMATSGANSDDYAHSNWSLSIPLVAGDTIKHVRNFGTVYQSAAEHAFYGRLLG